MFKETSKMEQRYDAVLGVIRDGFSVTEVARRFGVSRQSVHSWLQRYERGGLARGRASSDNATSGTTIAEPDHRESGGSHEDERGGLDDDREECHIKLSRGRSDTR